MTNRESALAYIDRIASPLSGAIADYDAVLDAIGDSSIVLIGESTHGTHEMYQARADITRRLILEKGFRAVAVEADWPDAYRANRYVRGAGDDRTAEHALRDFRRFPTWMWRNTAVLEFLEWLRQQNLPRAEADRTGFYGLDLYSLHSSIAAVLSHLEERAPDAAARARERYACFDRFGFEPQDYGYAAALDSGEGCEQEAIEQLNELIGHRWRHVRDGGIAESDECFWVEQNARVVLEAARYYRVMFLGGVASWNLRDGHMADTLDRLIAHLGHVGSGEPKVVVWAHNSHVGDARATSLGRRGEINLGQLVRERHGGKTFVLGFSGYEGTVTAASQWDGNAELKRLRPALRGSLEELLHHSAYDDFFLDLRKNGETGLGRQMLERAVGVLYLPDSERASHYFHAAPARQFDGIIHLDISRAVEPLERIQPVLPFEPPETFPAGV